MEGRKLTDPDEAKSEEKSETVLQESIDDSDEVVQLTDLHTFADALADDLDDDDPGYELPAIKRLPDGIEVTERPLGHAKAQWLLQVRCECGRRWFELQEVETATCPRCKTFLVVKVEGSKRT